MSLLVANPASLILFKSSVALGNLRCVCTQLSSGHWLNLTEKIGKNTKKKRKERLGKAQLHPTSTELKGRDAGWLLTFACGSSVQLLCQEENL